MNDENMDVCPVCGTIVEMGEKTCPNCSETFSEVDMDN